MALLKHIFTDKLSTHEMLHEEGKNAVLITTLFYGNKNADFEDHSVVSLQQIFTYFQTFYPSYVFHSSVVILFLLTKEYTD